MTFDYPNSIGSKIRVLRLNEHEWTEEDFWQGVEHCVSQNKAIEPLVGAAVAWSYKSVVKSAGRI